MTNTLTTIIESWREPRVVTILDHLKQKMGARRFERSMRRWLRRFWGLRIRPGDDVVGWLGTPQMRVTGHYLDGPRWRTLFFQDFFLRAYYGSRYQEDRPMNYASRHFGLAWMNVTKILRRPPGGARDPFIERWKYHRAYIHSHRDIIDHLATSAGIEKLAALTSGITAVAVVSESGTKPLIDPGQAEPNNRLLEHYKSLCNPAPFRKSLPPGFHWV